MKKDVLPIKIKVPKIKKDKGITELGGIIVTDSIKPNTGNNTTSKKDNGIIDLGGTPVIDSKIIKGSIKHK